MAQYNDINQFIYATIQEYIDSAKLCIDALKGGSANDCYGMSALVLLTSAIDAMGTYFRNSSYNLLPNDSKDWKQELGVAKNHYDNIYDEYFKNTQAFSDSKQFMDILYAEYRCHAVHNGMMTKTCLLRKGGTKKLPIIESVDGKSYLYIDRLYHLVKDVFQDFERDHPITPSQASQMQNMPESGVTGNINVVNMSN